MAAIGPPPEPRTDAAANCAEPAKVVALITTAGRAPIPPLVADSTPNDTPKSPTAIARGSAVMAPARSSKRIGAEVGSAMGRRVYRDRHPYRRDDVWPPRPHRRRRRTTPLPLCGRDLDSRGGRRRDFP